MTDDQNIKTYMMETFKKKFSGFIFWDRIEPELAVLCSDLPEPTSDDKKKKYIKILQKIKIFLVEHSIVEAELLFIDQEIERYERTTQISLYNEQEDMVDQELIQNYASDSYSQEGVVGIHLGLNYEQLKRLSNGVYKQTDLVKFYISREKTIYGKVTAERYDHPQNITVAKLVQSKKLKETGEPMNKFITLFGEKVDKTKFSTIKEIPAPFYVYDFKTTKGDYMLIMSVDKLEIGDYIITGVQTSCQDFKLMAETVRVPTSVPIFFAQECLSRIIKFEDHGSFRKRITELDITRKNMFNIPFSLIYTKGNEQIQKLLIYDKWYKWFIWAWLTHAPKGLFNSYPMHIMIIGPKCSGKSTLINELHCRSQESREVFSGSSSTLKSLIPSFKYNPARSGYLAECSRFAFCDEFLRCLMKSQGTGKFDNREESVAIMNDLLEHQKREASSGVSRIKVNMTARILATTNPIRGIHNVTDLINSMDESFLSRWQIYYQTPQDVEKVRQSNDIDLKELDYTITNTDFISLLDYLQSFDAIYDSKKITEIFDSVKPLLNETLLDHYHARHSHHIECLIDGIIKTRCLLDRDITFTAQEEDYEILKTVWTHLISSWIDGSMIKELPLEHRINYLPEHCQFLYKEIVKTKEGIHRLDLQDIGLREMDKREFTTAIVILIDHKLIRDYDGKVFSHDM